MSVPVIDVQKTYLAYFGRPADPVGLAYWMNSDAATMRAGFAASAEYATLYSGMTASQRVEQVYQNLLGRASDPVGKAYWVNEFNAGRETVSSLVVSMQTNALGVDIGTIGNRVTYAILFTAQLDTPAEVVGYSGTAAASAGRDAVSAVTYTDASLATARSTIVADTASVVAGIAPSVAAAAAAAAAAIPPSLSSSTADNATGVVVGSNLVLTFSEPIVLGTGDIVLKKTIGNVVVETFNVATGTGSAGGTVTASGAGVTINPFADLTGGTEYYVTVAATAVKDTTGNSYAGITSTTALSFFTATSGSAYSLTGGYDNITGTAGDDIFTGTYGDGAGPYTLQAADVLNGGAGTLDTLNITTGAEASTPGDGLWANKTNFEKIVFNSTGAGAQTITTGVNFNAAFGTGADLNVQTFEGAINVTMTGYLPTSTITTTTIGAGAHTIVTGTGTATVNAASQAAGSQTINGVGLTTVTATIAGAGNQVIGTTSGGNIVSVNATISGVGSQTITSTSASNVTVIASAFSGAQTITTAGGNDSITLTTATGQLTTISTGAGNDIIVGSLGTDTITAGLGADTMTGGGGTDTFAFSTGGSVIGTSMDIITDFNTAGADVLTFGAATTVLAADATALVAGSNVNTTAGGLITFHASDNTLALKITAVQADAQLDAAGSVAMFVDGANTYVYYAGAATGNTDDQLIQLTGITTLATITGGATTTIA